jgi:poly(3-hydroxybutyrate) depolymerase
MSSKPRIRNATPTCSAVERAPARCVRAIRRNAVHFRLDPARFDPDDRSERLGDELGLTDASDGCRRARAEEPRGARNRAMSAGKAISTIDRSAEVARAWAGAAQPARRGFGIASIGGARPSPVLTRDLAQTPFVTLVGFAHADAAGLPTILVVPPLSGHFPILLRDLVIGLLSDFRVLLLDWTNVRHVPLAKGSFGFDDNVGAVLWALRRERPSAVVGVCQGGVPALAATALLAGAAEPPPAALALIAAPIDPLARPTRVVRLLRERPLAWFEAAASLPVLEIYPGRGRRVYPAHLQLLALLTHLTRHLNRGGELMQKLRHDDGSDPRRFPFLDLYSAIMDLEGRHFVENIERVFHACHLRHGALRWRGERVDPGRIRATALLTVEGREDDIAAPGQTSAAHGLCPRVRAGRALIVPGAGHFGLFHGSLFRREVLPVLRGFCARH